MFFHIVAYWRGMESGVSGKCILWNWNALILLKWDPNDSFHKFGNEVCRLYFCTPLIMEGWGAWWMMRFWRRRHNPHSRPWWYRKARTDTNITPHVFGENSKKFGIALLVGNFLIVTELSLMLKLLSLLSTMVQCLLETHLNFKLGYCP